MQSPATLPQRGGTVSCCHTLPQQAPAFLRRTHKHNTQSFRVFKSGSSSGNAFARVAKRNTSNDRPGLVYAEAAPAAPPKVGFVP